MSVQDVILIPNEGAEEDPPGPARGPVQLAPDLQLVRLEAGDATAVMDACEPRGFHFTPVRQFGQRYTFVRSNPPGAPDAKWDPEGKLQRCLALSRLVRAHSGGLEYAARVVRSPEGKIELIEPAGIVGPGAQAWVADPGIPNWLTVGDVEYLRRLLEADASRQPPERVARALFYHEAAFRTKDGSICWVLVCTGIESLVHTDRNHNTRQFVDGLHALAQETDVRFADGEPEAAYDMRSSLAHGQGLRDVGEVTRNLYVRLETTLSRSIRKAIEDPAFAAHFETDDTIRQFRAPAAP